MSDYDPNYVETKYFYRVGVKIAIVNNKNEVLLLKRSNLTPRPGGLDLPGGAVDGHEAPEAAIIRETLEEVGLVITHPKITVSGLMEHEADSWVMLGFGIHVDDLEIILSWEHDKYLWIPLSEIESADLPEGFKQIVRAA